MRPASHRPAGGRRAALLWTRRALRTPAARLAGAVADVQAYLDQAAGELGRRLAALAEPPSRARHAG